MTKFIKSLKHDNFFEEIEKLKIEEIEKALNNQSINYINAFCKFYIKNPDSPVPIEYKIVNFGVLDPNDRDYMIYGTLYIESINDFWEKWNKFIKLKVFI